MPAFELAIPNVARKFPCPDPNAPKSLAETMKRQRERRERMRAFEKIEPEVIEVPKIIPIPEPKMLNAPLRSWFGPPIPMLETDDGVVPVIPRVMMPQIIHMVCEGEGVLIADALSIRRTQNLFLPRQIIMYLAKHLTTHSYPVIAKFLGDRDHTTVLHGVRKIERLVAAGDSVIIEKVERYRAELRKLTA